MMVKMFPAVTAGLLAIAFSASAQAGIIGVGGPVSTLGAAPAIVAAPPLLLDAAVTNRGLQGFNEQHSVLLAAPLATDQGVIAAGTRVHSHMVFFNQDPGQGGNSHSNVSFLFDNAILGTMSDFTGSFEAASSPFLGAPGTTYPGPFNARGLEGADTLSFSGRQLQISSFVGQPGDWVRVITAVPEPSSMLVFAGVFGAGLLARRRRRR